VDKAAETQGGQGKGESEVLVGGMTLAAASSIDSVKVGEKDTEFGMQYYF
jgi:hypothetical protein